MQQGIDRARRTFLRPTLPRIAAVPSPLQQGLLRMPRLTSPHAARRAASMAAGLVLAASSGTAAALEFSIGESTLRIDNLVTLGTLIRMQERDPSLVGKPNLQPGICVRREEPPDDGFSGPSLNEEENVFSGNTCNPNEMTGTENANSFYVRQPGSYNINGDNGNLNFDKGDVVHATAKLTTDITGDVFGFNLFTRFNTYYDHIYYNLDETRPDTTLVERHPEFSDIGKDRIGLTFDFLDYFISKNFEVLERPVIIKLGSQVLNWGESAFLVPNSLNSINPADQARLRIPGFDVKELAKPVGMLLVNAELFPSINMEAFYQYEWEPVVADPVGSFFSQSDILGEGGTYAMLSFGKAPEDPLGLYAPRRNPEDPAFVLASSSSRTIQRDLGEEARREPDGGGQYGVAFKYFAEWLNGGTELGVYFANYHARVPSISGFAADATCLPDAVPLPGAGVVANLVGIAQGCGLSAAEAATAVTNLLTQQSPSIPLTEDPLPLDSARIFVEYPEDIRMYGASFNTTVGDWALSGEYVWRENLPIQVHSVDLLFALLQPAFPENDLDLGIATLPGRRTAVPDFLQTNYRGVETLANQYVRGWEPMGVGQLGMTLLKTIGGDNLLNASQITVLLEGGFTHVPDLPDVSELQSNGAGTDTHISGGADGTIGINPRDIRSNPDEPTSDTRANQNLMQNPTSQYQRDRDGFGTKESYGYRFVTLTRYDSALFGANIEFLNAFFHDVGGVGPGLGQNFVEGRKQILSGIRFDYLSTWLGEVRYTWFTGGNKRDALRDRDNLLIYVGYQF